MIKNLAIVTLLIIILGSGAYIWINGSSLSIDEQVTETSEDAVTTEENASEENSVTEINVSTLSEDYTITESGEYELTGSNDDIQVIVNAPEQEVTLNLNSVTMSSQDSSAITVIDADKVYMNLIGESTISDTVNNSDSYQAPIFIDEVKTYINGEGTLNLIGNYQEGFESNNDLFIESGTLNITAVDDGINAGDLLQIDGGEIYIDSNGDGLDSNGDLIINGGYMEVSAGNNANGAIDYGESADNVFELNGGTIIAAGGPMGVNPTSTNQEYVYYSANGSSISVGDYSIDFPKSFSLVFVSYSSITTDQNADIDGTTYSPTTSVSNGMQNGGGQMGGSPR